MPAVCVDLTYEASRPKYNHEAEFFIASLHLCGNTGTYVDAPIHRYRDGIDLAGLPLERLAHVPVVMVDAGGSPSRGIDARAFRDLNVEGKAVLVHTGWSKHWGTDAYFEPNPFLTHDACEWLVEHGAVFTGIDSLNIDDVLNPARPAHTILLGQGIPVCEHMTNLSSVPRQDPGFLHAVPIPWKGGATFPVRAYLVRP